jgi:hypothetical protein
VIIDPHPNSGVDCCTDVCAVGDINRDGYLDVVIGGQEAASNGLVWYQYPAWSKHSISSGEFTTDGQTGDVDGDGDLDIIISDFGNGIFWYENPGGPATGSWTAHKIGDGYAHDLEVGDMDGDGDLEVVTCDKMEVVLWQQINPEQWAKHLLLAKNGEGTALADIDRDGDLDVVYGGLWLEAPSNIYGDSWPQHAIDSSWPSVTRARVADMNRDGRRDVILSVSEASGNVAWFEAPPNPKTGAWTRHLIESETLEGAHSLQVADVENDGDLDVVTAEMHTSPQKRVIVYVNEGGAAWIRHIIARTGSHNLRLGDIGKDGDMDVIGKNFGGPGRVIEMWENLSSVQARLVDVLPTSFELIK